MIKIIWAFIKRDTIEFASYKLSSILNVFSIIINLSIFFFIGKIIGFSASSHLASYSGNYFAFVFIGIAFSSYMGVCLTGLNASLQNEYHRRTIEAIFVTPIKIPLLLSGLISWHFLYATLEIIIYVLAGLFIFQLSFPQMNYLAVLLILIISLLVLFPLGIISASFLLVYKRGDPVNWLMNLSFELLGGVYFPITVMPEWLQKLSNIIPVSYTLNCLRLAILQGKTIVELKTDIFILCLYASFLIPLSLLIFRLALKKTKEKGSLSHF